jgi:hypothetical protein
MAAMLSAMNGCSARGLCLCSARATTSLPAEAAYRAEYVLHRGRLPQDLRHFAGRLFGARLPYALVDRAADQLDGLVDIERLGQVFEGATLER